MGTMLLTVSAGRETSPAEGHSLERSLTSFLSRLPATRQEWIYSLLVGVFGLGGQCLLAVALQYETAGVVSVTRSLDIVAAYIIQANARAQKK